MIEKSWKTEISFSEPFNQTFDGRYGQKWARSISKTTAIDAKELKSSKSDEKDYESEGSIPLDESDSTDSLVLTANDFNTGKGKKETALVSSKNLLPNRISESTEQSSTKMLDEWKSRVSRHHSPKRTSHDRNVHLSITTCNSSSLQSTSSRNYSPEIVPEQVKNEMHAELSNDSKMNDDSETTDFSEEVENVHEPDNELMMESLAELLDLDYEDILRINRLPSGDYDIIFKQ